MVKAIIMDMDGTLLSPSETILPETKAKLEELQDKGVTLILASGRSYTRLMPYAKELDMENHGGWLLEVDGISLYDLQNKKRNVLRTMEPAEIGPVFDDLVHQDCEVMACFDDGFFWHYSDAIGKKKEKLRKERNVPESYPWTGGPWSWLADLSGGYPKQTYTDTSAAINRPINKIQLMVEEEDMDKMFKYLTSTYGDRFEIFRTTPRQLEILPIGYSKGATLKRLMDKMGWAPEEVVAFGDGENDVSLFEVAGNSFAMGNAAPYVKEHAKAVTLTNAENGIAHALEGMGL